MYRAVIGLVLLATGTATAAPADTIVVARIVEAGPIGSGKCSQRSYEIAVDKHESGPSPGTKLWVHFEHCGGPAPTDLAGTGMKTGTADRLTLRPGASKNFGSGFMIVAARAP
jgi:hypothetical protein